MICKKSLLIRKIKKKCDEMKKNETQVKKLDKMLSFLARVKMQFKNSLTTNNSFLAKKPSHKEES